jgi:hypothetical protein
MSRIALVCAALLAILALAGCEASFSTGGIDSDEVAEEAQKQLTKVSEAHGGGAFPKVTCPDEIKEDEGETTVCHATYGGEQHEVTATVTETDSDNVNLEFEADALPEK